MNNIPISQSVYHSRKITINVRDENEFERIVQLKHQFKGQIVEQNEKIQTLDEEMEKVLLKAVDVNYFKNTLLQKQTQYSNEAGNKGGHFTNCNQDFLSLNPRQLMEKENEFQWFKYHLAENCYKDVELYIKQMQQYQTVVNEDFQEVKRLFNKSMEEVILDSQKFLEIIGKQKIQVQHKVKDLAKIIDTLNEQYQQQLKRYYAEENLGEKISKEVCHISDEFEDLRKTHSPLHRPQVEIIRRKSLQSFKRSPQHLYKRQHAHLRLVHFSLMDEENSPSNQYLAQVAKNRHVKLDSIYEGQFNQFSEENVPFDSYDSILCSEFGDSDPNEFGDFLMKAAENCKTIVQVLYNNTVGNKPPSGSFTPVFQGDYESNQDIFKDYQVLKETTIFHHNPELVGGKLAARINSTKIGKQGNIEVVAQFRDGVPLAVMRTDLKGLIISLNFSAGSNDHGIVKGLEIVVNALNSSLAK